jgi:hypothetical protein
MGIHLTIGFNLPSFAQNPSYASKAGYYESLGEEILGEGKCTGRRKDFQPAFKKLLSDLKPDDFGTPESVQGHLKNQNCKQCGPQTQPADSLRKLIEVTDVFTASEIVNEEHERDIQCMMVAMRQFPDRHESNGGFSYADCSGSRKALPQKGAKGWRPCRTREAAEAMAISLKLVASCTGNKESDMFSLMQHEGGFNLNIMSSTGAAGIGQFTQAAVDAVKEGSTGKNTDASFQEVTDAVTDARFQSAVPGVTCDRLKSYLQKFPVNTKSDCEMILPPANPLMSLMMSARMFKGSRDYFETLVEQKINVIREFNSVEKNPFNFETLFTEETRKRLVRALMLWSYNGGEGGVSAVFNHFMLKTFINRASFDVDRKTEKRTKTVNGKRVTYDYHFYEQRRYNKATTDDLLRGLEISLSKNYNDKRSKRRMEVSKYLPAIERQLEETNSAIAGNCFGAIPQPPFVEAVKPPATEATAAPTAVPASSPTESETGESHDS